MNKRDGYVVVVFSLSVMVSWSHGRLIIIIIKIITIITTLNIFINDASVIAFP